ncbi:hypothetical protein FSOLCH5_012958 [Fusarium solani]|jgi:hypothetical protein|uniref:uncharacterized protein n=1 Tax=Fusarium solani TaxID=169388 RepID=UPI00231F4550|nr:hypothetical protein MRS44_008054 [Fusarium solani]KAJ4219042.1 hypothetical protein NW759_008196 [Fusarium solani]
MQPKFLSLLAVMASTALAEVKHVEVVHVFQTLNVRAPAMGFTPHKRSAQDLFVRAKDDDECASSVLDLLKDMPTPTGDLLDWFLSDVPTADPCKLTIAASLSKPLETYLTKVGDYLVSINDDAEEIVKECSTINPQAGGLVPECSGGKGSMVFTDASTTRTASLEYVTVGGSGNAAAPRATGIVGVVAAAAVGAAGAVMAL